MQIGLFCQDVYETFKKPLSGGYTKILISTMAQQLPVGQGLLIVKDSPSHSDTSHSVGLLWTSDRPDAETSA